MSDLIVKDNVLMNASYNLDLVEQRLILLAIIEARESGKGINANDPLTVHAESYINQFGVHRNTAYQALKDACKDLFARQFSYQSRSEKGNIQHHLSRWVSEVIYIDNEATVKLIFAPAVVPLITRLEEQFSQYDIEQVAGINSAYAVRLYELLICWRSTGKTPVIELQEFRKRLGVLDDEYTRSDNFKRRVLELAIKQINEHTDITVTYEQHKRGRVITGFSFKFKQKQSKPADLPPPARDPDTPDLFTGKTDNEPRKPSKIKVEPLSELQAKKYAAQLKTSDAIIQFFGSLADYNAYYEKIYRILLNPNSANEKAQKVVFGALHGETDYKAS